MTVKIIKLCQLCCSCHYTLCLNVFINECLTASQLLVDILGENDSRRACFVSFVFWEMAYHGFCSVDHFGTQNYNIKTKLIIKNIWTQV